MKQNCILIGGAGFLGLNTAKALLNAGHKVVIVDKNFAALSFWPEIVNDLETHEIDYRDADRLCLILKNQDILFHFACASVPATSMLKIGEDVEKNVVASVKLFETAAKKGIKKIIFPSSGGTVYGNVDKLPIDENSSVNPVCSYGITKLMIEKYLFLFQQIYGLDYLIFRIANPYGPGQNPIGQQGLVAKIIHQISNNETITIFGEGKNKRDYIYIDDVVAAFLAGVRKEIRNDIFNIGTGEGKNINEIIGIVSEIIGLRPKLSFVEKRLIDVKSNILDNRKARTQLEWAPKVCLGEGIQKTYNWFKSAKDKMI